MIVFLYISPSVCSDYDEETVHQLCAK